MDMFNNAQMLSVSPKNTGGGGGGGTSDYNELSGKPSVNNVVLEGDKTLDELGIQKKGNYVSSEDIAKHNTSGVAHKDIRDSIPTKTSQLTNDSGFITDINAHNHDDLYYSKKEVDDKIGEMCVLLKSTYFDFPNIGENNVLYVDYSDSATYVWNDKTSAYICVGRDFSNINTIDGGGAKWQI